MLAKIYDTLVSAFIYLTEAGWVPDFLLRAGIRQLLALRANMAAGMSLEDLTSYKRKFVAELRKMPIAIHTADANEQHYEVPTPYYLLCLGKHLKYSSCLYRTPKDTLSQAEENMLAESCKRADLEDGQDVLELGCGWGSLSLFMAARYPGSKITAVSNSRTQREFIMSQAEQRGLKNLQVITANMVDFQAPGTYDRVVSVEMFEHMKNYAALLEKVAQWLRPNGKLFVHIFIHKSLPYHFEIDSSADWMSKYFFTGGTMPSLDLLMYFQDHLALENVWYVNGTHYSRTLEAWLVEHDAERRDIVELFVPTYGSLEAAKTWFHRWRIFYIACSELFRYKGGEEWGVAHYVFHKK